MSCRRKRCERAMREIEAELDERVQYFKENGKLLEAQRIEQRTQLRYGDAARDRLLHGH